MSNLTSKTSIDLQDRDFAVLRGLFECRVMALQHIATLFFDGRADAAKKRIGKLKSASFIADRPRRHHEPSILTLTRLGFETLRQHGKLLAYPDTTWMHVKGRLKVSDLTLRHELEVMTTRAALTTAVRQSKNVEIIEFCSWPALIEFVSRPHFGANDVVVKPDGFIRIHERESEGALFEHNFYVELDRGTEVQNTLVSRAACYVDHYRRGGLAVRHGRPPEEFKDFPFRILIILKSWERRNNTAERLLLLDPPILTQVWLTTLTEFVGDSLGKIWIRPLDYRAVTKGTGFEPDHARVGRGYRRESERQALVEKGVKKHRLLGTENGPD